MDDDRARELLAEERRRIEQALATSTVVTTDDESTADDADNATDTYQNEFDEGRSDDLNEQLAAVERAVEQREVHRELLFAARSSPAAEPASAG